jgi:plasmid maintenance system antidote protein VapI
MQSLEVIGSFSLRGFRHLVNCKAGVSPEMAIRLSKALCGDLSS